MTAQGDQAVTDQEERAEGERKRDDAGAGEPSMVPDAADTDEAAAIVAALSIHLHETAAASDDDESAWAGRRWAFAGRSVALGGRAVRIPTDAPTDDWTALGRADRL